MRVVVAGATGAIGAVLTGQLLAAGHEVLGRPRTASGATALPNLGAEPHVVDLLDRAALLASFEGKEADAVVHQGTALSKMPVAHRHLHATNRLRTEGTSNLVELVAPRQGSTVSMVHPEDAAAAAVAALKTGRAGSAYNIADDQPCTWTSYMQTISTAVGGRPPLLLPNGLLRVSPYLGTLMTSAGLSLDSSRAERELGWKPRFPTVEDGLQDVVRRRSNRS
jgi:nucleoside-diphosphate-sugar epimerase